MTVLSVHNNLEPFPQSMEMGSSREAETHTVQLICYSSYNCNTETKLSKSTVSTKLSNTAV